MMYCVGGQVSDFVHRGGSTRKRNRWMYIPEVKERRSVADVVMMVVCSISLASAVAVGVMILVMM